MFLYNHSLGWLRPLAELLYRRVLCIVAFFRRGMVGRHPTTTTTLPVSILDTDLYKVW
jgi:hypothetical protein